MNEKKSPAIEQFLEGFSKDAFGRSRKESMQNEICVSCGCYAKVFRDEISRREYFISGLCQQCQDETFGK